MSLNTEIYSILSEHVRLESPYCYCDDHCTCDPHVEWHNAFLKILETLKKKGIDTDK